MKNKHRRPDNTNEVRIFIREVLMAESSTPMSWLTGVGREPIKVGTKLSDKFEGTPVAVIVGFMSDPMSAEEMVSFARGEAQGAEGKTPIAKVYSQAAGNKQFEFQDIAGKKKSTTIYTFDPVSSGLGRYLTVEEIKNSSFEADINKPEGKWLATHVGRAGNLSVMPLERPKWRLESTEDITDVSFFQSSQLFVPYLDKLYVPEFNRYSTNAEENKNTTCLLSTSEFLRNLPAYVAHITRKDPPQGLSLKDKDILRMNVCMQEGSQGLLYKLGTAVIAGLATGLGAPTMATYGALQIIPAIGPMVYHVESENYTAVAFYILQIAVDIWGIGLPGESMKNALAIVLDIVFSIILSQVSSPSAKAQISAIFKDVETLEDAIALQREIKNSSSSDFQGFEELVPAL